MSLIPGADELGPDEMPIGDEGGCDNTTSTQKPLTTNQKNVVPTSITIVDTRARRNS